MSRASILGVIGLLATSAGAFGCTVKTVDSPVTVSTKLLPELAKADMAGSGKEVTGTSCDRVVLLFIPVGFATVESAYGDALSKAPGADTLIRFEERTSLLFVTPFYWQVCTEVHGYAVSSKALTSE